QIVLRKRRELRFGWPAGVDGELDGTVIVRLARIAPRHLALCPCPALLAGRPFHGEPPASSFRDELKCSLPNSPRGEFKCPPVDSPRGESEASLRISGQLAVLRAPARAAVVSRSVVSRSVIDRLDPPGAGGQLACRPDQEPSGQLQVVRVERERRVGPPFRDRPPRAGAGDHPPAQGAL